MYKLLHYLMPANIYSEIGGLPDVL